MVYDEHESTARFLLPATGVTIDILPGSEIEVEVIYREIFEDGVYCKHGRNVADRMKDEAGAGGSKQVMNVKALLNVALGDRVCAAGVPFTLFPRHPGNSTLNPEERIRVQRGIVEPYFFEGARQYVVPMTTLSDVMEERGIERVDILKVDVEGAELMVLKGVQDVHWSRISQVVMEVPDIDEEIYTEGTIASVKRVLLITQLLKKHGFMVITEFDPNGKNHMVYARRI
ncbi:hypothetical protein GOP47_0011316 [Adiantum capillus-veneris]|uniref:Methyltransferase FkbM domain-containing protein n=1 Tax=Adiantum capillus-veneris TaxID=13818 RepID=A0A9D4USK1_ADICA|nr:hypothetical protein GOP47_0011316 [Adiantum capillus-veneris]